MPNFTRLAIHRVALACAANGDDNSSSQSTQHRRHLLEDPQECVLYLKEIQFKDPALHQATWSCQVGSKQGQTRAATLGSAIMEVEGVPKEWIEAHPVISGQSVLKTRGAYVRESIATGEVTMVVPNGASVSIESLPEDDRRHCRQQQLRGRYNLDVIGNKTTLVVRVVDSQNHTVNATLAQLQDDVFLDSVSLKTQYAACSHDQLIIEPANVNSNTSKGVVEITLDVAVANVSYRVLLSMVVTKAKKLYDGLSQFQFVLFCQPLHGNWLAYAYVNGRDSFYNGHWCQRVSAQMHEIGHNLGLHHSSVGTNEYGDKSGMMGYSYNEDDVPQQCFNPTKNYQLG